MLPSIKVLLVSIVANMEGKGLEGPSVPYRQTYTLQVTRYFLYLQ